jgi:HD-GYP domain-containing protein (c-di-GMP phosphodiesterase class II)
MQIRVTAGQRLLRLHTFGTRNLHIACRPQFRSLPIWTMRLLMADEHLVGEARERRTQRMDGRERTVDSVSALLFLAAAIAIALLVPNQRDTDLVLTICLVIGMAAVTRVTFEYGDLYTSAEELVFVPLLFLAPLNLVPLLAGLAYVLAVLPELLRGEWSRERWITAVGDSWYCVGPVLVLAEFAPGPPSLDHVGVYLGAMATVLLLQTAWVLIRDRFLQKKPVLELLRLCANGYRVSMTFFVVAFFPALAAAEEPLVLITIAPLVWLLTVFSRDRSERWSATLELHRAYRGTVMLLVDVVEHDDDYTAEHSRSVVELARGVAQEMEMDKYELQELEFAALLHDVGKIAIPKPILHKPAALTESEFEVMKTHTIEGQFMLDRIGGLLGRVGEIVRSCHERWDGKGYPDGLKREEIPLAARIVFVCDAYNAMTTNRPYRAALPHEQAIAELVENAGTQFDPEVVAAMVKVIAEAPAEPSTQDHIRAVLAGAQERERLGAASEA